MEIRYILSLVSSRKSAGCPMALISSGAVPLAKAAMVEFTAVAFVAVVFVAVAFFGGANCGSAGEVHARIVPAITAPIAAAN